MEFLCWDSHLAAPLLCGPFRRGALVVPAQLGRAPARPTSTLYKAYNGWDIQRFTQTQTQTHTHTHTPPWNVHLGAPHICEPFRPGALAVPAQLGRAQVRINVVHLGSVPMSMYNCSLDPCMYRCPPCLVTSGFFCVGQSFV